MKSNSKIKTREIQTHDALPTIFGANVTLGGSWLMQ